MITIMVGLPSSGKTTAARILAKESNALICTKESFFTKGIQRLNAGGDIIIDSPNTSWSDRAEVIKTAKAMNICLEAIVMATPYYFCVAQARRRHKGRIPGIELMYRNFDMPCVEEGFDAVRFRYMASKNGWCHCSCIDYPFSNYPYYLITKKLGEVSYSEYLLQTAEKLLHTSRNLVQAALIHAAPSTQNCPYTNVAYESMFISGIDDPATVGAILSYFDYPQCCPIESLSEPVRRLHEAAHSEHKALQPEEVFACLKAIKDYLE